MYRTYVLSLTTNSICAVCIDTWNKPIRSIIINANDHSKLDELLPFSTQNLKLTQYLRQLKCNQRSIGIAFSLNKCGIGRVRYHVVSGFYTYLNRSVFVVQIYSERSNDACIHHVQISFMYGWSEYVYMLRKIDFDLVNV